MPTPLAQAQRELLKRLLEAHERSTSFGRPGPWPRDVIVRLNAREFPEAFGPDGREQLAALREAAVALEKSGASRIVRDKGPLIGLVKELRLAAEHVEAAYTLASDHGFSRLAAAFDSLSATCRELRAEQPQPPEWMLAFLQATEGAARDFDASPLGASRLGLKKSISEWTSALRGAAGVSRGWNAWERVVSERIFRDSKTFGALRATIVDILVRADPQWDGVPPDDHDQVLEAYGVRRKPGLIRCAGVGTLRIASRAYALEDFAPTAHLPEAWSRQWVEGVQARTKTVTLVENEYPFLSYVEEAGGSIGLGARDELAVYVAGFPTPGLVEVLAALAQAAPESRWRHWGDADVGGVRIWWFLRNKIGRPLEWFRSTTTWLEGVAATGTPMSAKERGALEQLEKKIFDSPIRDAPDVQEVATFVKTLREIGRKVEQERF